MSTIKWSNLWSNWHFKNFLLTSMLKKQYFKHKTKILRVVQLTIDFKIHDNSSLKA